MPGNGDISRKREDGRAQAGEQVGELSTADVGDLGGAQVRHVAGGQDLIPKTPLGPDQEALSLQGFALPFGEAQALGLAVQALEPLIVEWPPLSIAPERQIEVSKVELGAGHLGLGGGQFQERQGLGQSPLAPVEAAEVVGGKGGVGRGAMRPNQPGFGLIESASGLGDQAQVAEGFGVRVPDKHFEVAGLRAIQIAGLVSFNGFGEVSGKRYEYRT
jgi:hypothetical protein